MSQVFIVSACRTPIGAFQGQFERISPVELGTIATAEAIKRAGLSPENVDQVILGHVLTAGQGQNPARQVALNAKVPITATAFTINMLCGSGLKSVGLAYQAIKCGDADVIVSGGQESMTRAQHCSYVRGSKLGSLDLKDSLIFDGLTCATNQIHMGNTAEHLAKKYGVTREQQDEFAAISQQKAEKAIKSGHFDKEIVQIPNKRKGPITKDEFPKPGTTVESLSKLSPCFETGGTVTPGNASGINDGAAALVIAGQQAINKFNLKPLAKIIGFAEGGNTPIEMGIAPITVVQKLLTKVGWTREEVDLYELNEAFASQSVIVLNELKLDPAKVNISGGAIALGHPIGCSGARVLVTLIHNLERLGLKKGVAALCIGGGMAVAIAIEMC